MTKETIHKLVVYSFRTLVTLLIAGVGLLANAYVDAQVVHTQLNANQKALTEKVKEVAQAPMLVQLNAKDIKITKENLNEFKQDFKEYRSVVMKQHSKQMDDMLELKILLIQIKNKQ